MSTFREEFISLIEAPAVQRVLEDLDLLSQAESANLVTFLFLHFWLISYLAGHWTGWPPLWSAESGAGG